MRKTAHSRLGQETKKGQMSCWDFSSIDLASEGSRVRHCTCAQLSIAQRFLFNATAIIDLDNPAIIMLLIYIVSR